MYFFYKKKQNKDGEKTKRRQKGCNNIWKVEKSKSGKNWNLIRKTSENAIIKNLPPHKWLLKYWPFLKTHKVGNMFTKCIKHQNNFYIGNLKKNYLFLILFDQISNFWLKFVLLIINFTISHKFCLFTRILIFVNKISLPNSD